MTLITIVLEDAAESHFRNVNTSLLFQLLLFLLSPVSCYDPSIGDTFMDIAADDGIDCLACWNREEPGNVLSLELDS